MEDGKRGERKERGREECMECRVKQADRESERAAPYLQQALLQDLYGEIDAFRVLAPAHRSERTRAEDFKHLAVEGGGGGGVWAWALEVGMAAGSCRNVFDDGSIFVT
jgi:hypothetical protein